MDEEAGRLDEAERVLLATWRAFRRASGPAPQLDPVERQVLDTWRRWRRSPATRPPWAAALQHRLSSEQPPPTPVSGLADESGYLPESPSRLLGMLLGGAVGEAVARGRTRGVGERTSALAFALEGLVRAHATLRSTGAEEPVRAVLGALQRWLHTRGVQWPDCVPPDGPDQPAGWLVEQIPRDTSVEDPTAVSALARVAAGLPPGTPWQPITRSGTATAVPLGALAALWSSDEEAVVALGTELAALTHGAPAGHLAAGALARTTRSLLRGTSLRAGFEHALEQWGPEGPPPELGRALRLGLTRPAGYLPGRTQLDAMGAGRSGVEVLGIALRVALASEDDFTTAVRISADHGGDTGTSAMLCGLLLGALHGPSVIPAEWLDLLPVRTQLESLAEDAASEFGPYPDESEDWFVRYPREVVELTPPAHTSRHRTGLAAVPRLAASRDRFLGAVLGCAVGEALGGPITGDSWGEIQDRHGSGGLREYVPAGHPSGRLGSDTQLLLFSLEGTIRAGVSRRQEGTTEPFRHIQHAYQRWLHTQHLSWPRAAGEFLQRTPQPDGWLVEQRALFQTRNPGRTMMRTLIAFAKGQQAMGSPDNPVSESRGSTAVMRAVPAALWSDDPVEAFRVGMRTASLTHGAPAAYLSAGALAFLVSLLMRGEKLRTATTEALEELSQHQGHEEVSRRLSAAVRLSEAGAVPPGEVESTLGTGWTAPEALGIGLYAAAVAGKDFDAALHLAVNHSGNSATTGAVCGSLLGSAVGAAEIPERWVTNLELGEVIERLAHDAALEFGPHPPDWGDRYPPT